MPVVDAPDSGFADFGFDDEEWTEDDYYTFYGATTSESWFSRWNPKTNTDWHAATKSSLNTHNLQYTSGDVFGNTIFTGSDDTYPLLAHSNYPTTWPIALNTETLEDEPFWPGWWKKRYIGDSPNLLLQNEIFDDISTLITSANFYDPLHQRIFNTRGR